MDYNEGRVKPSAFLAIFLALGGISLGVYAFIKNASPYVSAKEASARPGTPVHVAGKIDHSSTRSSANSLEFILIDDHGDPMPVVYSGMKPANFDAAPKASVSGTFKDGKFVADQIATQCPSKYESETKSVLPKSASQTPASP
jgi:cytochrome c-type biogenesis protein CcmE